MSPEVESLERAMRDLLSLLDQPLDGNLAAAWARCEIAGTALQLRLDSSSELCENERQELRDGLNRLMRLNAIARQSLLRGQENVSKELATTRRNTAQVRAYAPAAKSTGGTCDLAG